MQNENSSKTLSRIVYLFLCENQVEAESYSSIFPSASGDAIFYCWKENCNASRFRSQSKIFVSSWSKTEKSREFLVSNSPEDDFLPVEPRVYVINENELNLKERSTWTTARNFLYNFAAKIEEKQKWRWAFFVFADGDVHCACPLAEQLIKNRLIVDYGNNEENLFSTVFRSFVDLTESVSDEGKCFLLFDAFLLRISPAVATISGTGSPMAFPGLLSQVVYHIDAMFNAIHRDAADFLLPYCPRYDKRTWWTSQAIFVYRSLCLYGHVLQFDPVHVIRQNHRAYPRHGDPWAIDDDMNLVPNYLLRLKNYMKQSRFVSVLLLHNYAGWDLELSSETCRFQQTNIRLQDCRVLPKNFSQ